MLSDPEQVIIHMRTVRPCTDIEDGYVGRMSKVKELCLG